MLHMHVYHTHIYVYFIYITYMCVYVIYILNELVKRISLYKPNFPGLLI